MDELESEIWLWQEKTFPEASWLSVFLHLQEEVAELEEALYASECHGSVDGAPWEELYDEIGDVGLLLCGLAHHVGTTLENCIQRKFNKARLRTYEYDAVKGYAKHV